MEFGRKGHYGKFILRFGFEIVRVKTTIQLTFYSIMT